MLLQVLFYDEEIDHSLSQYYESLKRAVKSYAPSQVVWKYLNTY